MTDLELMRKGDEKALFKALKEIVYKGASDQGVALVMSYCAARKIDPMLKPVHIVPMKSKKKVGNREEYIEEETIMPGIGLHRIQASRSGCAGISEAIFGAKIKEKLGNTEMTYPEYAKVIVKRILANGSTAEFVGQAIWIETYKNKGYIWEEGAGGKKFKTNKIDRTPSEMWEKRPFGQIAKCAEADALRKAFPEEVDHTPTFEEQAEITIKKSLHAEKILHPSTNFLEQTKAVEEWSIEEIENELSLCQTLSDLEIKYTEFYFNPAYKKHRGRIIEAKDLRKDYLFSLEKEKKPTEQNNKNEGHEEWLKAAGFDSETGEILKEETENGTNDSDT